VEATCTDALHVASLGYLAPSIFWWVITLGYLLVEEQFAVSRTQSTFGRFVTPSVARTIMDREERGGLQLGGEMKEITVLIGDTVNVASRLTSSDIARRDQVAVSQELLSLLGDDVAAVDLGAIVVKGRNEAVHCFQIDRVGMIANPNPAPPPEVPVGKAAVA